MAHVEDRMKIILEGLSKEDLEKLSLYLIKLLKKFADYMMGYSG